MARNRLHACINGSIERLKDALALFPRNTDPVVTHADCDSLWSRTDIHFDRPGTGGILDCITEHIDEDLTEAIFISEQGGRCGTTHHDAMRRMHLLHHLSSLVEDLIEIDTLLHIR